MKTAILCALFLIVGAAAGSALTGYFVNHFYKSQLASFYAMDVASSAMHAEFIKLGDAEMLLGMLERGLPDSVIAIHNNELVRDSMGADTAMMATKRFYVCTKTPIPVEISGILEPVSLRADACGEPQR